jgi:Ni/Co efflux regulator RcnB
MKRLIIIMLGMAFTTGAMAQTKKAEEKDLKKTIEAKKDEKKEVGDDLKHLKVGQAVEDRKDVRAIRKNEHRKAKHLKKAHGVKNPVHKAEKEIREEKKN